MRAKRVDANHGEVREALRRKGWDVTDLSAIGGGMPDLLAVWGANPGPADQAFLIEVKDGGKIPSKRKLTPAQVKLHAAFAAAGIPVVVIETVEQAEAL